MLQPRLKIMTAVFLQLQRGCMKHAGRGVIRHKSERVLNKQASRLPDVKASHFTAFRSAAEAACPVEAACYVRPSGESLNRHIIRDDHLDHPRSVQSWISPSYASLDGSN